MGGWVKSGFKAFGDYYVVSRRQKVKSKMNQFKDIYFMPVYQYISRANLFDCETLQLILGLSMIELLCYSLTAAADLLSRFLRQQNKKRKPARLEIPWLHIFS
jgi:hypothetical protein